MAIRDDKVVADRWIPDVQGHVGGTNPENAEHDSYSLSAGRHAQSDPVIFPTPVGVQKTGDTFRPRVKLTVRDFFVLDAERYLFGHSCGNTHEQFDKVLRVFNGVVRNAVFRHVYP